MPEIQPSVDKQEILCAEIPGEPCGLAVFGASGDLTKRKLIDSLFQLFRRGLLSDKFYFIGCGRKDITDDDYRDIVAVRFIPRRAYSGRTYSVGTL